MGSMLMKADEKLVISSGTINIAGSYEGLEGLHVEVSGDGITLYANGKLTISGAYTVICSPTRGDTATLSL